MRPHLFFLVTVSLVGYLVFPLVALRGVDQPGASLDPAEALRKASVNGKYRMLLRQIKVPGDAEFYSGVHDLGYRERPTYAGLTDLPRGHWVYVAPCWYIWRDRSVSPRPRRAWGPEQVTGPPDTWPQSGDLTSAWASLSQDAQEEWLLLEYEKPIVPDTILVYATFNPGAVHRVTVFRLDGTEVEAWKGTDPCPVGSARGVSVIPVRVPFKVARIKVYLASKEVGGWNEIDAVGLRSRGRIFWATGAEASTTYAQLATPAVASMPLDRLEMEVKELKERVRLLQERIKKRVARHGLR
jgi:hypothetical protein